MGQNLIYQGEWRGAEASDRASIPSCARELPRLSGPSNQRRNAEKGPLASLHGLRIFNFMFNDQQNNSQFIGQDRKSTRLNSSHSQISYAVFCLKKKKRYPDR